MDGSGNAYIAGATSSSNFPTSVNAYQGTLRGVYDAFVTKINADGTLAYSTYLGGTGIEDGYGIAVDGSGSAYITGDTNSSDFPTKNATQPIFGGVDDAFVTKINANGTLAYSTYLGGSGTDYGQGIAVDGSGSAYITGVTSSSSDFPTKNATQPIFGGVDDAFVTKMNPDGSLAWSTYLGGNSIEEGSGIAVDSSGSAYITGWTASSNFPTTVNAYQGTSGGAWDAFVTKINADGTLAYSTYLGGSDNEFGQGIAVDSSGSAYITGWTASSNFPTTVNAYQGTSGGLNDAFIAKINPAGSALVYSTYLGGSDYDSGNGIAVDSSWNAYITGSTASPNFPTLNPLQPTNAGGTDAFVAKILQILLPVPPTAAGQIPINGLEANHEGAAAWSSTGGAEPAKTGHALSWTACGGGHAAYYMASRDFGGIDPSSSGGVRGLAGLSGFPQFAQALADNGFTIGDLKVSWGLQTLGTDILGVDWFFGDLVENRFYRGGNFKIKLAGQDMVGGFMPKTTVIIDYKDPNNCFDDRIFGYTDPVQPVNQSAASSATVQAVAAAFLNDLGSSGIRFVFDSFQPAVKQPQFTGNGRVGAYFEVQRGGIETTPSYTITDLGTLGGVESWARGINNSGQVVGWSDLPGYTATHAFLYDGTSMHDLGTLGGTNSWAYGINNSGQVVGASDTAGSQQHAFLYSGGTMHDLGTLGGTYSSAYGINDSGQVVGMSESTGPQGHAFLYSGGTMHDLGTLGGSYSSAYGINNSGQASGTAGNNPYTALHAFLYSGGTMHDLGTLGGSESWGYGINNSGQVVGMSFITGNTFTHAFLYDGTSMHDLGTLGGTVSEAYAINNFGWVVGMSEYTGDTPFLYDGTSMHNLNTLIPSSSGWFLEDAWGINDHGQIVGRGIINGKPHVFLMTPTISYTALGSNVTVSPPGSGTTITFSTVSSPGNTSVTTSSSGPTPPSGFQLLGNYYNIMTTATYTPPVTVCITNSAITTTSQLLHYENHWVNVTITPVIPPTICGHVNSLSPFVIAQMLPPVALCQNVTAPADSNCTASASINNGSYDPDAGDSITLTQLPAEPYQKGTTSVTLTVTDSKGLSSQCLGTVTVVDKTPPTITSVSASPSTLWPPNHKMVDVTINYSATDNCGPPTSKISGVTSNEPISSSDYAILDAHHVNLSADRLGSGNGRIYTIALTCTDSSGNSSSQSVMVTVPHDQGKK